jgi:hypothetical protein
VDIRTGAIPKKRLYEKCGSYIGIMLAVLLLILAPLGAAATPATSHDAWWADYFPNTTLSGSPALNRYDREIGFFWGAGSPGAGVPADNFSARWTRNVWFDDGTYRFLARSDDGLRVWVGETLVVDAWYDQQANLITRDLYFPHGVYPVRVEYYERGGGAQVQLAWQRLAGGQGWLGEYYANQNLAGEPTLTRPDGAINFAWEGGSPHPEIPADRFSVRWSRTLGFPAGAYRFYAAADDGVRIWVDGQPVLSTWYRQAMPNRHWGDIVLDERPHQVRVEYFEEGGGAQVHVWWERLGEFTGWKGEYYDNRDMYWPPVMIRDDAEINFDWGAAPPADWMPDDSFAVVWSREMTFAPGYYRLAVQADDGARVWLDGRLTIDKWQEMNYELHYVDGTFLSGAHQFKVEYFEKSGNARIRFWVSPTPWKGEYFANPNLAGEPVLVELYEDLNFDWGFGAPAVKVPADNFSARWTSRQQFSAGLYTFNVTSDDGVRLIIDDKLVLDSWRLMHDSTSVKHYLTAGEHTVVLEYFEGTGVAQVRLEWYSLSGGTAPSNVGRPESPTPNVGRRESPTPQVSEPDPEHYLRSIV